MLLTYTNPDGSTAAMKISAQPILIGRDAASTIVIEDGRVSRSHCSIQMQKGVCWLRDLGSSNGTWVNGANVAEARLQSGDEISVGSRLFTCAAEKPAGPQTIFRQTAQEMSEGQGYGTLLRKIANDIG